MDTHQDKHVAVAIDRQGVRLGELHAPATMPISSNGGQEFGRDSCSICGGFLGAGVADTAATLLVAAGSNPERLNSEASFASLCGVNPIPASSGKTNRHRLNRGGHRQANAALHRIVVVRLRYDPRTQSYMRRRTMEGMSKAEIIRCLKRYVAREVFSALRTSAQTVQTTT